MNRTAKQIQTVFYTLLRGSELEAGVSGNVYRNGMRPRDSRMEDVVVTFTAGLPGDIATGIVTVNIYVPDIDPFDNGQWVEDGQRVEEIEVLAQQWAESLTAGVSPGYYIRLKETIHTNADEAINQHFVVVRLDYKIALQ